MKLDLLEVGQNTEKLSACRLSLILGVYTSNNLIDTFSKIARRILKVDKSILGFHKEPYIWYTSATGFWAFEMPKDLYMLNYINNEKHIDSSHAEYTEMSNYVKHLGVSHNRIISFNLMATETLSIGHAVFFDHKDDPFDPEDIKLVQEFADGLVGLIRLHEDYNELKELYEQQSALNFSKTKFFQIIAHDLRAPFHGLLGFSEVLAQERETLDETSVQNIADYLHDNAQSTYNLLESLLTWAMAEGGRFVYHPINFELNQCSKIVTEVLKSLAFKKQIQLVDEIPKGLKTFADINMITSVIQNLVSNALKFTPVDQNGVVTISAKLCEDDILLTVQDNGIGMTSEQVEKLFDSEFVLSVRGTAQEKGAGLGLVLCKRFVELNQGKLYVESIEGRGTKFCVRLPKMTNDHQVLCAEKHHAAN